ncbi:MAG: hydantoinase/oxoprolinase family protein [Paracoccaceae bacterium]
MARRFGLEKVVSYDMGGTTAKICLIEEFAPKTARSFEVARTTRFAKGSGMPISIPVIEMIEIGAGGGSVAWVDSMGRIQTGPESAGSEPGPACYQRGGTRPAITDADLMLAKLDPDNFAGGVIRLSTGQAAAAIAGHVGERLGLSPQSAAFGICEVVDENMANAARVHAVENGKNISDNIMVAFGGAAPLHAARLCEKLGIDRCLVPPGAGVGSAIGFLKAPFGYEALASRIIGLSAFEPAAFNRLVEGLKETARGFVAQGTNGAILCETVAYMRYRGQGWEIPVPLPDRPLTAADAGLIRDGFRAAYARFFGRAIDGLDGQGAGLEIEIVTLSVKATDQRPAPERVALTTGVRAVDAAQMRAVFDPASGADLPTAIVARDSLAPGDRISGPAIVVERETSTVVTSPFDVVMQADGSLLILRKGA